MNIKDISMNAQDREMLEAGVIDEDQVSRSVILEDGESTWLGNEESQPIE